MYIYIYTHIQCRFRDYDNMSSLTCDMSQCRDHNAEIMSHVTCHSVESMITFNV